MADKNKPSVRKGESAVERQIREAIENGEFENLSGAGRPLDLDENPYAPPEWRMTFKLLKDAGLAPDWIEQGKEIRRELLALDRWFAQQQDWHRKLPGRMKELPADKLISERERLIRLREETCRSFRRRADEINRVIDLYNLKAPRASLQRTKISIDEEIRRFLEQLG